MPNGSKLEVSHPPERGISTEVVHTKVLGPQRKDHCGVSKTRDISRWYALDGRRDCSVDNSIGAGACVEGDYVCELSGLYSGSQRPSALAIRSPSFAVQRSQVDAISRRAHSEAGWSARAFRGHNRDQV